MKKLRELYNFSSFTNFSNFFFYTYLAKYQHSFSYKQKKKLYLQP